jgi:hypothetical protein
VVSDEKDEVVLRRRELNLLEHVLRDLEPFGSQLVGVAVESTYNWYWLVDGLMEAGYRVQLVNTAAVRQYDGIKYSNDWSDARWLAHLLRLGLLPEGYIYPGAQRPVRDLLRKRTCLRIRTCQPVKSGEFWMNPTRTSLKRYSSTTWYKTAGGCWRAPDCWTRMRSRKIPSQASKAQTAISRKAGSPLLSASHSRAR